MKNYLDLKIGYSDAVNYSRRENKQLFNEIFVKGQQLEKLLQPCVYFLIGGKGTGKTAYSTFLSNNEYKETNSRSAFLSETEYRKFITLKEAEQLVFSDYVNVWNVLLLTLLSKQVKDGESSFTSMRNFAEYNKLDNAIDSFYQDGFTPEIMSAFNIIERSEVAANIIAERPIRKSEVSAKINEEVAHDEHKFQMNLMALERRFKSVISKLKLQKNHILFIDGIDIRPKNLDYDIYLECIKGLAQSVWNLNNDFLSGINDSKGRLRIVLLLRPDIFSELGLQNLNNKLRDNSVLLDWRTSMASYRESAIFHVADRLLAAQQSDKPLNGGDCWDHYFPFKSGEEDSFESFLLLSLFRPRDIITLMNILQEYMNESHDDTGYVSQALFDDPQIRSKYSDYLLGEIKDYLLFYHSEKDYSTFLKFFEFLNGKHSFSYDEYIYAYEQFAKYVEARNIDVPEYMETSGNLLQFLYDLDVIGYTIKQSDGSNQSHWSFRDRNYSDLAPKIPEGCDYSIQLGLRKALNIGKSLRIKRSSIKTRRLKHHKS